VDHHTEVPILRIIEKWVALTLFNLLIEFSFAVGKPILSNHCADTLQVDISWLSASGLRAGGLAETGRNDLQKPAYRNSRYKHRYNKDARYKASALQLGWREMEIRQMPFFYGPLCWVATSVTI
jgi:hypothetical protein